MSNKPKSGSTAPRRTAEQAMRDHTLGSWGGNDNRPVRAPRFPTKSLKDDELISEIGRAPEGDYLNALKAEAEKRGLEI